MTSENNYSARFRSYFENHSTEALDFIRWLVEQESMSRVPDATSRIAENLAARIADLGGKVERFYDSRCGTTLLARFYGDSDDAAGRHEPKKQLLIVGHLDTVWPIGTLAARPFRVEDGR